VKARPYVMFIPQNIVPISFPYCGGLWSRLRFLISVVVRGGGART
jgi:hypothetical protein